MTLSERLGAAGFPTEAPHPSFEAFFTPTKLQELADIRQKISTDNFFPRVDRVLRFAHTDPTALRCIIVGMDPYPSFTVDPHTGVVLPEATGRAFEVASVQRWEEKYRQSSLRNILKSVYYLEKGTVPTMEQLRTELQDGSFPILPPHAWMDSLESQGVLFLNASLTVLPGEPGSHAALWDGFVTDLMTFLAQSSPDAPWLLWGNLARERVPAAVKNRILSTHPRLPAFVTQCPFAQVGSVHWLG